MTDSRPPQMPPQVRRFRSLEELSQAAAEFVAELAVQSVAARGVFTLALSGGGTPRPLYERLGRPPYVDRVPWKQTHLFWGDERWVPPGDAESNFGMAAQALLSRIEIPPGNVHRIPAELEPPEAAARTYEETLRRFFGPAPAFDLNLLGMGPDGHTASLFPGAAALEERERWVVAVPSAPLPPHLPRVSLTLPAINAARCVMFLVSGAAKRELVQRILDRPEEAARLYPAGRVHPSGRLFWFIGED